MSLCTRHSKTIPSPKEYSNLDKYAVSFFDPNLTITTPLPKHRTGMSLDPTSTPSIRPPLTSSLRPSLHLPLYLCCPIDVMVVSYSGHHARRTVIAPSLALSSSKMSPALDLSAINSNSAPAKSIKPGGFTATNLRPPPLSASPPNCDSMTSSG